MTYQLEPHEILQLIAHNAERARHSPGQRDLTYWADHLLQLAFELNEQCRAQVLGRPPAKPSLAQAIVKAGETVKHSPKDGQPTPDPVA